MTISRYSRAAALTLIYAAIIAASFWLAYEIRFEFRVPLAYHHQFLHYVGLVVILKLGALAATKQFRSMLTYFGVTDLIRVVTAMLFCTAVLMLAHVFIHRLFVIPRGMLLVDYMLCLGALCSARMGARLYRERITSGGKRSRLPTQRIAIVGAGDAGATLASEFLNHPNRGFRPVAFYDDNASKHHHLVHGVPVLGTPDHIAVLTANDRISKIVIAMPSAPAKRIAEIVGYANEAGLKVETLPSLEELASGRVRASRIRPVEVQDLLGREAVNLDSDGIRKLVENRIVMVTGAGGSIGAELCRQIAALNPKRLVMVEQSEGNLFTIEQELIELGVGAVVLPLVADVLHRERMESIFSRYSPEVVFHAAAHKHVYLMERQAAEAVANNVFGTRLVARLAAQYRVKTFILISTDKAINPTSVMGATKRLAEIQIQALQAVQPEQGTKFMAVRFGNVLGSSGSVIPIFKRQIDNGGPVTVTHPEVMRYFMTIPEAVGLVLQSAVMGKGGEIFVLDMGQPVKIVDLANQMIQLSGYKPGEDIEIKFTGLKPGEKLFEELQHKTEKFHATEHPRVMRFVSESPFSESGVAELEERLYVMHASEVKKHLQKMVPEYVPYLD